MRSLYTTMLCLLLLASLAACSRVPQDTPRDPAERTREPGSLITATPLPPTPESSEPGLPEPTPAAEPTAAPEVEGPGTLLYTRFDEAANSTELRAISLADGAERTLLTCADRCSIWGLEPSPDGAKVAYLAGRPDGSRGLYLADLASGETEQIARGDVSLGRAPFSPDGSRLAFILNGPTEGMMPPGAAYVSDLDGGEPRQVSPAYNGLSELSWLDGETLVASGHFGNSGLGTTLRIAALGDHEPAVLSEGRAIGLSPDRTKLLLEYFPFTDNIAADQRFVFRVLSLEAQQLEVVVDLPLTMGAPIWSPDGEHLLHMGLNSLELINVLTGRQQVLQVFEGKHSFNSRPVWSRDGGSLIYSVPIYGEQPGTEIRQLSIEDESERLLAAIPGSVTPLLAVAP